MLRRSDDQFVYNASSYINSLDHLDSLHFSSDVGQCTSKAMDLQRLRLLQQLYEAHRLNVQNQIVIAQILVDRQRRRRPRPRRYWVKPWLSRRLDYGHYDRLMRELEAEDVVSFRNFVRMDPAMFREVLQRVGPRIEKYDTWFRKSINPGCRLAITLRFLATGEKYRSLMFGFRVAHNTISVIVRQTCEAIVAEYGEEVMQCPRTSDAWKQVAAEFSSRWNFHHTLGAIDGKHVAIRCPKNGGSLYFNYKGFHSIILLALVDAKYKFLWVDVGTNGSSSDAQIFNDCDLRSGIIDGTLDVPDAEPLPGDDRDMPYFLIGNDAFSLRIWLMKPFSARGLPDEERIYNYRLSRARRVVENAFGIMANRFGCLLTTMCQNPETLTSIVLACCTLHNIMRLRYPGIHQGLGDEEDDNHRVIPGQWRQGACLQDIEDVTGGNRDTQVAKRQRLYLKHYYNAPVGATAWQRDMI